MQQLLDVFRDQVDFLSGKEWFCWWILGNKTSCKECSAGAANMAEVRVITATHHICKAFQPPVSLIRLQWHPASPSMFIQRDRLSNPNHMIH
jgi:hypothetical protein